MRHFRYFGFLLCAFSAIKQIECDGFFERIGAIITGTKEGVFNENVDSAYKFGQTVFKPALSFITGSTDDEKPQQIDQRFSEETTTPYNIANYVYSPGYYSNSLIKCPLDVLKGETIEITCKSEGKINSCDEYIFVHDTVTIQCKTGYEYPVVSGIKTEIECLENGKWSAPIFECVSSCGRVTKKAKALVIHGSDTEVTEFPWNVAIYLSNVLICGGSILSERVILSAAHCFMKETMLGIEREPKENYNIVVGKYFRNLNASETYPTQSLKIKKVQIHAAYSGYIGNYDADIAVVTVAEKIIYQVHIAPICLDLDLKTLAERQIPPHGTMGLVAGYGFTETHGTPSDRLKKIELPIVDIKICKQEAPNNFKKFVTSDKVCAGYNDGTGAVCKGDSGAGYVVGQTVGDETIYYIHGIVSNSRAFNGGCDINFYTMFTHVQNYVDMIKEEIRLSKLDL